MPAEPTAAASGRGSAVDLLLSAVDAGVRLIDLAQPLTDTTPCSPNAPGFRMALLRRHGDAELEDGFSFAADLIVTGSHVGTHVDALAHVSHHGTLYGGEPAAQAQTGGRLNVHDVSSMPPMFCRGVLLDVARTHGVECLPPGYGITRSDLMAAARQDEITVQPGDVVLIRSGWGRKFNSPQEFVGLDAGVPGVTEDAGRWLVEEQVRATGGETIAYEQIKPGAGHSRMPVHRLLLVEHGIPIIEVMNLEKIAREEARVFLFVLAPLPLVGATGSPTRPLAIVG